MIQETDTRATARQPNLSPEAARRLDYQVSIGQMVFRALIAVNGGGLLALFVVVGQSDGALDGDPRKLWLAFALFVLGLCATIASGIGAFLSQRCYYDVALTPEGTEHDARAHKTGCLGDTMLIAASVCVVIGALAFLTGAGFAMAGAA